MNTADIQTLAGQVLAQAATVVGIVAMLRMALRRFIGTDPSAGVLLTLNALANAALTVSILLQSGADFGDLHTYGMIAGVTLVTTVLAHGGYDLVATRAKATIASVPAVLSISAPTPSPVPVPVIASSEVKSETDPTGQPDTPDSGALGAPLAPAA